MKFWQWLKKLQKFTAWQKKLVWNDYGELCGLCGGAQNLIYFRKGIIKWLICPACNGMGCFNHSEGQKS